MQKHIFRGPLMSEIMKNDAGIGSLIGLLKGVMVAVAVVGLVAFTVGWLMDRPTPAVFADTSADPTSTPHTAPSPARIAATPSPSSRAQPTRVAEGELTSSPTPSPTTALSRHLVREGETLTVIARTYGFSVEELARVNELANPDLVYVGQRLALPSSVRTP